MSTDISTTLPLGNGNVLLEFIPYIAHNYQSWVLHIIDEQSNTEAWDGVQKVFPSEKDFELEINGFICHCKNDIYKNYTKQQLFIIRKQLADWLIQFGFKPKSFTIV